MNILYKIFEDNNVPNRGIRVSINSRKLLFADGSIAWVRDYRDNNEYILENIYKEKMLAKRKDFIILKED